MPELVPVMRIAPEVWTGNVLLREVHAYKATRLTTRGALDAMLLPSR